MVYDFQAQLAGTRSGVQKFSQYYPSSMLPPPPPAPMARPVAIIRSTGDLTSNSANSPPTSSTSPSDQSDMGPNQEQMAAAAAVGLVSSCQSSVDPGGRKSPARILVTAPHTSREYTFAHFHSQPGQVSKFSIFYLLQSFKTLKFLDYGDVSSLKQGRDTKFETLSKSRAETVYLNSS